MNVSEQLPTAPRRLELGDDLSFRFWEISVEGSVIRRRFGLIGRPGRTILTECADSEAAAAAAEHFLVDKLLDGYQPIPRAPQDRIPNRSLARLERSHTSPNVNKAIRIFADTQRPIAVLASPRLT